MATFNKWSLGNSPFCYLFKRRIGKSEKVPFIATNNWIILAVRWSVKYIFALSSSIFEKSCTGEEGEKGNGNKALCFSIKP